MFTREKKRATLLFPLNNHHVSPEKERLSYGKEAHEKIR